ncbi:MAG TPA: FecR family protein, partial [Spirochaetia bacterium]|nr:FecR family protein [Spirochaetia bacterium]
MKKFLLLSIIIFSAVAFAVSAQSSQPAAVLQYFDDPTQITVTDASGNAVTSIYYGMDLPPGSVVKTGNSTAEIQLDPNGSILKLADNTNFTIQTLQGSANQTVNAFSLLAGRLRTIAAKSSTGGDNYSIQTPTAVCGVRGTDFTLDVVPGQTDAVGVINGVVNFVNTSTGQSIDVTAGNFANTFAQVFQPVKMSADQISQLFDKMNFEKLNPSTVPGHAAETQQAQAQTETPPAVQPPAEQPKPVEAAAPKKPGPLDPLLNYLRDNLGMQIGTITIDGITYSKAVLQPQFTLGKLKMALYLPVIYQNDIFNPDTWYHPAGNNEWNFGTGTGTGLTDTLSRIEDAGRDLMLKIRYIEWGQQRDPFFFKVGNLNDMTVGHGLLMYNYANDQDFPAIRRIGFNLGIDLKRFGFESVVNDLADPQIFGGRIYIRPFGKGFLKPALGFSGIADISPASDLASSGATNLYGDPIFIALGPDLDLPVIDTDKFSIIAFADLGGMMPYYRQSITNGAITIPTGLDTQALIDTSSGTLTLRNYG